LLPERYEDLGSEVLEFIFSATFAVLSGLSVQKLLTAKFAKKGREERRAIQLD